MSVKKIFLLTFFTLIIACNVDDDDLINKVPAFEWTFIACEGNYGSSNGSITMINGKGDIKELNDIGDVVNSLAIYKNKLIVLVNNSHKILIYEIAKARIEISNKPNHWFRNVSFVHNS